MYFIVVGVLLLHGYVVSFLTEWLVKKGEKGERKETTLEKMSISKRTIDFCNDLILKNNFDRHNTKLRRTQRIHFYKQCSKPCNLFTILNSRFVLRHTNSNKKVYF